MLWKILMNIFRFTGIILYLKVQPPDYIGKLLHWLLGVIAKASSCIRNSQTECGNNAVLDNDLLFLNRNNSALTFQSDKNCADSDSKVEVEQFNVTPSEGTSEMQSVSEDHKDVKSLFRFNKIDPQTVHNNGAQAHKNKNRIGAKPMQVLHTRLRPRLFYQCHKIMLPVRLAITTKVIVEQQDVSTEYFLLMLGDYINDYVGKMTDLKRITKWQRYLWMFVAQAADMDHTALQQVYMLAVSRREAQILSQVKTERFTEDIEKPGKSEVKKLKDDPPFTTCLSDVNCDNNYYKDNETGLSEVKKINDDPPFTKCLSDMNCDNNYYKDNETGLSEVKEIKDDPPFTKCLSDMNCDNNYYQENETGQSEVKQIKGDPPFTKCLSDMNCDNNYYKESESRHECFKDDTLHGSEKDKSHHKSHNGKNNLEPYEDICCGESYRTKNQLENRNDKFASESHKKNYFHESFRDNRKHESVRDQSIMDIPCHQFHSLIDQHFNQLSKEKNRDVDHKVDGASLHDHQLQYQYLDYIESQLNPHYGSGSSSQDYHYCSRNSTDLYYEYIEQMLESNSSDSERCEGPASDCIEFDFIERYLHGASVRDWLYSAPANKAWVPVPDCDSSDSARCAGTLRKRKLDDFCPMSERQKVKFSRRHYS